MAYSLSISEQGKEGIRHQQRQMPAQIFLDCSQVSFGIAIGLQLGKPNKKTEGEVQAKYFEHLQWCSVCDYRQIKFIAKRQNVPV
jgi:hypothetical protein